MAKTSLVTVARMCKIPDSLKYSLLQSSRPRRSWPHLNNSSGHEANSPPHGHTILLTIPAKKKEMAERIKKHLSSVLH